MNKRVAFRSLGCKLNQYEVQALREGFLNHGFREVSFSESADYYVLNTCTVTAGADADARRLIGACRRLNPAAGIVVTGCYATAEPEALRAAPGVLRVVDNASKNRILYAVTGIEETREEESPFFKKGISYFDGRSRAFVKVQDGCNYFCTFCKIPYVRGRLVSRDETTIVDEIRRLRDYGYEEIALSGVCLGSYGKDAGGRARLTDLIRRILDLEGRFRVRLSSIDPRDTPLDLARLMRETDRLCPHLHLSLQSGDDGILRRMRRGYTTHDFRELVDQIRALVPQIGFSTDVIAGFPGEDEAAFERTALFLDKIEFHRVHVFPYSARPGTRALGLDKVLPGSVVKDRVRILRERLGPVTRRLLEAQTGRTFDVLVESKTSHEGLYQGFAGNYMKCVFPADESLKGRLVRFCAQTAHDDYLTGRLEEETP